MKPAAFQYELPKTLAEALVLLSEEDAIALAGGQSLMPLLNFRMAAPEIIVDLNDIAELRNLSVEQNHLKVGAMVRHQVIEFDPRIRAHVPIMSEAMTHVAHVQIKTRGTIGGNVCNAHPASEMPAVLTALDATFHCQSQNGGGRAIAAADFFEGALENALEEDELLTAIQVPFQNPNWGWAFDEVTRRHGDFAIGGAAVLIGMDGGVITYARLVLCGVGDGPMKLGELENWLVGKPVDADFVGRVEVKFAELYDSFEDSSMNADNKSKLLAALLSRTFEKALTRASSAKPEEAN